MSTIAISFIALGILLLAASLATAREICNNTRYIGWRLLTLLIFLFIAGYSAIFLILLNDSDVGHVMFALSSILFAGSVFVFMVTRFSLSSISRLKDLAEQEKYNSLHDSLTGLPNRKYCIDALDEYIVNGRTFQFLLLDIVNFKQVNDGMGHFCGDQLLIQIGHRLSALMGQDAMLARLGGDEFAVIAKLEHRTEGLKLAKKINKALSQPFLLEGFELTSSAAIGISRFPDHGLSAEALMKSADMAMYWAKNNGNLIAHYDERMYQGAKQKLQISRQIDAALETNEFQIFYQPIINSKKEAVCGYEALIRWIKDDGTVISPVDFIPIAEQSHKIVSITNWVLKRVTRDIAQFQQSGIHYPLHINLSAKDLMGQGLVNQLRELVDEHPEITDYIVLEITESTAINRLHSPEKLLSSIRALGFKISLDDFGTGYSSLSLLRDLPVDQIKIDRSFLYQLDTNDRNDSIVANAITLAHGLGYTVVAEGVEDQSVLRTLKGYGCDYIQGYYYSPAMALDQAIRWTHDHTTQTAAPLAQSHSL
ncbi:EAL domain-containing protein [Vibrio cholerae]